MEEAKKSTRLEANDIDSFEGITDAFRYITTLRKGAILRAHKMGIDFSEDDYKWIIGIKALTDITAAGSTVYLNWPITKLFGISVEIDAHNPHSIQLWENITNTI